MRVEVFSTVLIIPTHSLANVYRLDPEMLNVRTMFLVKFYPMFNLLNSILFLSLSLFPTNSELASKSVFSQHMV